MVEAMDSALGYLTLLGQLIGVVIILSLIFRKHPLSKRFLRFFTKNAVVFALIVATIASLGSLFYSEVAHYPPCILCWYQRILMYPQIAVMAVALKTREDSPLLISLVLSGIGAFIAGYHYLLQMGITHIVPCSTVGQSVSCADKLVMHLGYITIPLMAFTAFALIILSILALRLNNKKLDPQWVEPFAT